MVGVTVYLWLAVVSLQPVSSDATHLPGDLGADDPRAPIIERTLGRDVRFTRSDHFLVYYHPEAAELIPRALETAEQVHRDVVEWAAGVHIAAPEPHQPHVMLFVADLPMLVRAVPAGAPAVANFATGFYSLPDRLLCFSDARHGTQRRHDLDDLLDDHGVHMYIRERIRLAEIGGGPVEFSLHHEPLRPYTVPQARHILQRLEEEFERELARLTTVEAGVETYMIRHEIAHQVLLEHGVTGDYSPIWVHEGMGTLFEAVERDSEGRIRPAFNVRRWNWIRNILDNKGVIGWEVPAERYSLDAIVRALDVRDILYLDMDRPGIEEAAGPLYARAWSLAYYVQERRPEVLALLLEHTKPDDVGVSPADGYWTTFYEQHFGGPLDMNRAFAQFVLDQLLDDEQRLRAEWQAMRESP